MCIESPRWTSALLFSKLFTSFLIMPIQLNWHCSVIWWQSSWLHFTSSCQPLTAGCTVTKSGSVTVCLRIHPPTSSFQKRNLQATLQCAFLTRPHHKHIIWMILEGPKPQTLDFPFPMQVKRLTSGGAQHWNLPGWWPGARFISQLLTFWAVQLTQGWWLCLLSDVLGFVQVHPENSQEFAVPASGNVPSIGSDGWEHRLQPRTHLSFKAKQNGNWDVAD